MPIRQEELDEAVVSAARKRFRISKQRAGMKWKCQLSFSELLRVLTRDCKSFTAIGEKAGISRERVRQIYQEYFAELFPHRQNGLKRSRLCALKRERKAASGLPKHEPARSIARLAGEQGLSFHQVKLSSNRDPYRTKMLVVGGKLCVIRQSSVPYAYSPERAYSKLMISKEALDGARFVLFLQEWDKTNRRVWIFPAGVLLDGEENGKRREIYLPVERRPLYRNTLQRIDWWPYAEAWNLLR